MCEQSGTSSTTYGSCDHASELLSEPPPITAMASQPTQHAFLLEPASEDLEGRERGPPQHTMDLRRTPVWGAIVNSISFMCVPRSIPACFAQTGWPIGMLALLYSSVVTYDTGILLGRLCADVPASMSSFPALAAEAAGRVAARRGSDSRAQEAWRRAGHRTVAVLQYTCYYLTGVSELLYFEQFCVQLFATSPLCQWQWLLVVGLISLPVLQVRCPP